MKAEIISVGTELLLGHTINSDAAFVARELAAAGISLLHSQVVGDNPKRLMEALESAASRADLLITTGGLGPTKDDLTKNIVADFAKAPLEEDADTAKWLMEYFGEANFTENQLGQALKPRGSTILKNANGTAPGFIVPFGDGKFVILLPGPPRELLPMLENEVRPFLRSLAKGRILSTLIRTFGIGEGSAAALLGDLLDGANPTVAPYAAEGEMFLKVTARAENMEKARELLEPVTDEIRKRLGDVVYALDAPSLENVVVNKLIEFHKTITTAESCTGGLLAKRITDQPGSSEIFRLGLITYANEAKEKILGVPHDLLMAHGAVSAEVAASMAENARRINKSALGVGITGIAGPGGGTPEKPVGLVYIALAFDGGLWVRKMPPRKHYPGRAMTRMRAASHALDLVRRHLGDLDQDSDIQWF